MVFAEIWGDGYLAFDVGPKLTCTELDALVVFLYYTGNREAAEDWLRGHAAEDDDGDSHGPYWATIDDEESEAEPSEFDAAAYLDRLLKDPGDVESPEEPEVSV